MPDFFLQHGQNVNVRNITMPKEEKELSKKQLISEIDGLLADMDRDTLDAQYAILSGQANQHDVAFYLAAVSEMSSDGDEPETESDEDEDADEDEPAPKRGVGRPKGSTKAAKAPAKSSKKSRHDEDEDEDEDADEDYTPPRKSRR